MKKILTALVAALTLGTAAASAQIEQEGFGVRIGWDLTSPSTNIDKIANLYSNGSGLSFGAYYDIPLYRALYFEPGLSFFYNTMGITDVGVLGGGPGTYVIDGSLRNCGFRVPMIFGYRFDFTDDMALSVVTGPQANLGLSLKEHFPDFGSSDNYYGNGWHRLDAQWLFGVKFHYQDHWVAELIGGVGMTNMASHGLRVRRNTFSISVGYQF